MGQSKWGEITVEQSHDVGNVLRTRFHLGHHPHSQFHHFIVVKIHVVDGVRFFARYDGDIVFGRILRRLDLGQTSPGTRMDHRGGNGFAVHARRISHTIFGI